MSKKIIFSNQKGGVSKTTSSIAIASRLKNLGYKVLAVDLDPQGNLSDGIGIDNDSNTVYELLKGSISAREAIKHSDCFDVIPANIMLSGADLEFTTTGKEYRLKEALEPIEKDYEFIVIDTPPSLGILTVNAFTYADEIIIPTTAGIFAVNGIIQLYKSIETVKKYCNPELKVAGILVTKYNSRTVISKDIREVTQTLAEHLDIKIFDTFIRQSIMVEEAQANHKDIFSYNSENAVSKDYIKFVDEYLKGE